MDNTEGDNVRNPGETQQDEGEAAPTVPGQVEVAPRLMPPAKKALADHGLNRRDVPGTGPADRVLPSDVAGHEEASAQRRGDESRAEPADRLRLARQLAARREGVPPKHVHCDVDMAAISELMRRRGESAGPDAPWRLTFVVKAICRAIRRWPAMNAQVSGDDAYDPESVEVAVPIRTDCGTAYPVIREADRMRFADLSRSIEDFTRRARTGALDPGDLEGGTFLVQDGSASGVILTTPELPAGMVGSLGIHAVETRPVVRAGSVVVRPMMLIALSYDGRFVDDPTAAAFLGDVARQLADPAPMLIRG